MIIRVLYRVFPDSEPEVALFQAAILSEEDAAAAVCAYFDRVAGTYPDLRVLVVERAKKIEVRPGLFMLQ